MRVTKIDHPEKRRINSFNYKRYPYWFYLYQNQIIMALQPWRKGIVIKIEDHTHNTRRFWIQIPELEKFDFIPGQFVTLDLPIHEKPNKRWRSYSIASWPDDTNVFELLIVLAEGGLGTNYLFSEIKVGSELTFRGAQGVFTLPEKIEKDTFLVRKRKDKRWGKEPEWFIDHICNSYLKYGKSRASIPEVLVINGTSPANIGQIVSAFILNKLVLH